MGENKKKINFLDFIFLCIRGKKEKLFALHYSSFHLLLLLLLLLCWNVPIFNVHQFVAVCRCVINHFFWWWFCFALSNRVSSTASSSSPLLLLWL